jgi:branched-chain amino acid transport system substrate-binding protein
LRLRRRRATNLAHGFAGRADALPRARLFGTDGIAESGFADPRQGGVPARVGRRVVVTVATLSPDAMPEAGRAMLQRYAAGPRRRAVIRWLHDVRNRQSVLGTYSFDRFGDTTLPHPRRRAAVGRRSARALRGLARCVRIADAS